MNTDGHIDDLQFEEIERYLMNDMSPTNRLVFEQKLASDNALHQATQQMRVMMIGIQEASLNQKLDEFHTSTSGNYQHTHNVGRRILLSRWVMAAAIIGVISLGLYWIFANNRPSTSLYSQYYSPDPGLITSMSTSENYSFQKAMVEYKNGEYNKAIRGWKELAPFENSDTLSYFLASAYMATEQIQLAVPLFENVNADSSSAFGNDAAWYAGLCHLKAGRIKEAVVYFKRAERSEAEEIISRIKQ